MARRALLLALVAAALLVPAGTASAVNVDCAGLQAALNAAVGGTADQRDIVLDGMCTTQYTLPSFPDPGGGSHTQWTLRGAGSDDGFDRNEVAGRALTGADVHHLEIQNLIFRDGRQTGNGGAISITGRSAPAIRTSTFQNNQATGRGGAVYISQTQHAGLFGIGISGNTFGSTTNPALGNSADVGGALSIETPGQSQNSGINTSIFANNVATTTGGGFDYALAPAGVENFSLDSNVVADNKAGGSGGGGHVVIGGPSILSINSNQFLRNSLEPLTGAPAGDHFGGGLYLRSSGSAIGNQQNPSHRENLFRDNEIEAFAGDHDYGGGGEAIIGTNVGSMDDVYRSNAVPGQPDADFESEGGGLFFQSLGTSRNFHALNLRMSGNSVGTRGVGGGIYLGADDCTVPCPSSLELVHGTLTANNVEAGGVGPGIGGGGDDVINLENSIVYGNVGGVQDIADIDLARSSFAYTDACNTGGVGYPGAGNMCTDPLLVNPAGGDLHQTAQSPTIDKGDNQLFEDEGEACCDFEDDQRPRASNTTEHVDIGADERPPRPPLQQGPPRTPAPRPQCADGRDNDGDGAVDIRDPGCLLNGAYSALDRDESNEDVRDLVLCGRRQISLVRADSRGKRVALSGLVAARFAGKPVSIYANYRRRGRAGKFRKVKTVRAKSNGQFSARVRGPRRKVFNKARFRAKVDRFRSVALKLPQSLASTSVKASGGQIVLRGKVKRSVLGKRRPVVVKRLVCGVGLKVGQARPNRKGRYVVRFKAPALASAALYRAETRVLSRPRSRRYVRQFARAISITLTGQSG